MSDSKVSCPICVESYDDPDDICSTVCGHIFHLTCLLQWKEQSNTCPMCNRRNPEPHRIFIDISAVAGISSADNENNRKVAIKGIPPSQITTPLSTVVLKLIGIMRVPIRQSDIEVTQVTASTLEVLFRTIQQKNMFLGNKFRLKLNSDTLNVVIHEILGPETRALFQYAHKLKAFDYKIFFIRNLNVYVKKSKKSDEIHITSMEQVDKICSELRNGSPVPAAVQRRRRNAQPTSQRNAAARAAPNNEASQIRPRTEEEVDTDDISWTELLLSLDRDQANIIAETEPRQRNIVPTEDHQTSCMSSFKKLFKKLWNKLKRN